MSAAIFGQDLYSPDLFDGRELAIPDDARSDLHAYFGGILTHLGCVPIEINTEPDHAHLLFVLSRTETVSNVVGQLKKSSNDWLRAKDQRRSVFLAGWIRGVLGERVSG